MSVKQNEYIKTFNKENYKMYQFRIKKADAELISFLDAIKGRNAYIKDLIENDRDNNYVLSLKQIKKIILPLLKDYGIDDVYLFGSYARGEANKNSDVDIYCNRGNVRTLLDQVALEEELKSALGKSVDVVFTTSTMSEGFRKHLNEDLIKLC